MSALTLYQIETELLELLQFRDDVADEVRVTSEDRADQDQQLLAIDNQIALYVRDQVAKVDNIAGLLRECKARAATLKAEEERIRGLRKRWEDREQRVKERASEVMAMQIPPEQISAAHQNQVLKRLTGKSSELKLVKSPVSVEVTDQSLLPSEMQTVTVVMTLADWIRLTDAIPVHWLSLDKAQPDKRAIGAALKSGEAVPGARLIQDSVHLRLG